MVLLEDRLARPLRTLRVSVTDRCNLRCAYCMPEAEYVWLPRADLLTFEEVDRLVGVFAALGVNRVRLTGGEPLLRRDLPRLVERLARREGIDDLAITTNGVLFASQAAALREAGLHRVTVSLDTLDPARFQTLARSDRLDAVLEGIAVARDLFGSLKLDTVLMRGVNDDELLPMLDFARRMNAEVRFIEYMDVAGATRWTPERVVSRAEILERIAAARGEVRPLPSPPSAPADRFQLQDGTTFGVIASTTTPFCRTCDRARLTADGQMFLCLYATRGLDLRGPLRAGASDEEMRQIIARAWQARDDRGAERRLERADRAADVPISTLRREPHLEMHTRGG